MIGHRSSRFIANGLVVSLFSLVGLAGLVRLPPLGHILADARPATPTLEPLGTLQSSPGPMAAESALCRTVGTPFEVDPANENLLWAQIQNSGSVTATLQAIELGWYGSAVLKEVTVRRGTAPAVPVYTDPATSPALLVLRDPGAGNLVLTPGATLALGLRFEVAEATDLLSMLGPVVGQMREGCAVPMGGAVARLRRCPVDLGSISIPDKQPNRIQFTVINGGEVAVQLATLEVSWPAKDNGRLAAIYVNDQLVHVVETGPATSPAVIDLRRLGIGAVEVKPKLEARVRLEFEKAVAAAPYVVTVATQAGCVATTSTWVAKANADCGVEAVGFERLGRTAGLRLSNGRPVTRTLTSLDIFWPVAAAGALAEVRVAGVRAWSGQANRSPASLVLSTGVVITPRSTAEVQLVFTPTTSGGVVMRRGNLGGEVMTDGGGTGEWSARSDSAGAANTRGAAGIAVGTRGDSGGDFTIVVGFESGCRVVFSTLAGRAFGCSLAASEVAVDQLAREASVTLTNAAADATLRLLAVSWPGRNGALTGVWLGNESLFDEKGEAMPGPRPFTIELAAGNDAVVPRSQSQALRLRFKDRAARGGYMLSMSFEDPLGAECRLLVTSPQVEPDCRLSLSSPRIADERFAEFDLRNEGRDEVEIHFVHGDWPNPTKVNLLNQIAMVAPGSAQPMVVWDPQGTESPKRPPARVFPNGAETPIIDAETTVTLRLRFSELLNFITDPERAFKLTVGAVEDCQATYAVDGEELPPERVSFGGVIRELPPSGPNVAGLFGIWLIESQGQGEVRLVEVDRGTRFQPSTVTPREGDIVQVQALKSDGETLRAVEITFRLAEQGTSLLGTVVDMDSEAAPPTWIDVGSGVVGRRVWILDTTVIQGELLPGVEVSVEGTRNADDSVKATLIKVTSLPAGMIIIARGVIQADVEVDAAGQIWAVDKYRVRVPTSQVPQWVKQKAAKRPTPGDWVEITGHLQPQNSIIASEPPRLLPEPTTRRLVGRVTALPVGRPLGSWTIETDDQQLLTFTVESLAIVDASSAPIDLDMRVQAIVQDTNGSLVALRVRMDWP